MYILFFILGACFGSFFSVCIHRIPKGLSIISPRSYCPMCKHVIKWYDNIPIISYCILKGKCRYCGKKISMLYIGVELITAGVFLIALIKFGISIKFLIYLILFSLLIIISFIDMRTEIVPDIITMPAIIIGIMASIFTVSVISSLKPLGNIGKIYSSIIGGTVGASVIAIFAIIGRLIFKQEAMGGGDIKLLAMIGTFIGWLNVLWTIFIGSFIGLIFGIIMRRRKIPFAPALSIATFIIVVIGTPIIA
ncbi:MAG: prepilin peptidase [bacterium]|nr:prepilin peptidase [bacterium]